ncbi:MAG TPA: YARHG domain-containing protein [Clostridiaceae bacterium]|nr:YARHG domain-containing protein [Clostridiaceae bacterium]
MFCNNCGARVDENARFCGECGSKIVIPDFTEATEVLINSPVVCRNCGTELDPNGLFCGECGTPVNSSVKKQDVISNNQSFIPVNNFIPDNQELTSNNHNTNQEITQYIDQTTAVQPLNQRHELSKEQLPVQETHKSKENLTPLITALAVVLVVCSGVIWFVLKWSSQPISIDIPADEEKLSEEKPSEEKPDSDEELNSDEIADDKVKDKGNEDSEVGSEPAVNESEPAAIDETSEAIASDANNIAADANNESVAEPDFLFPSDSELITEEYLMELTKDEVALLRNEIFARHGYIFRTEPFRTYFSNKPWYTPNENFDDSLLSEIEKANVNTILAYEEKMGWR